MKKKLNIFIGCAFFVLIALPLFNLNFAKVLNKNDEKWWHRSVLYNFDFVLPTINQFLYSYGISTNPNKVIIGKNGWLYLGDAYSKTISVKRYETGADDKETIKKISRATKLWEQWLALRGVRLFRVMLGPDKDTIYPEFLPDWIHPVNGYVTDTLLANVDQGHYIDTRPVLRDAKAQFSNILYFKTDTHWNSLGAWLAFRAFTKEIAKIEPELRQLTDNQVFVSKITKRYGGDLGNFLRIKEKLDDDDVLMEIATAPLIETEQYNFQTKQLITSGGNPKIEAKQFPVLIKSKYALNQKRVLWLCDSFGAAVTPFMAATFSEIVQLHYFKANPERFIQLVNSYKPDYVFITVVERDTRGRWFEGLPS